MIFAATVWYVFFGSLYVVFTQSLLPKSLEPLECPSPRDVFHLNQANHSLSKQSAKIVWKAQDATFRIYCQLAVSDQVWNIFFKNLGFLINEETGKGLDQGGGGETDSDSDNSVQEASYVDTAKLVGLAPQPLLLAS